MALVHQDRQRLGYLNRQGMPLLNQVAQQVAQNVMRQVMNRAHNPLYENVNQRHRRYQYEEFKTNEDQEIYRRQQDALRRIKGKLKKSKLKEPSKKKPKKSKPSKPYTPIEQRSDWYIRDKKQASRSYYN